MKLHHFVLPGFTSLLLACGGHSHARGTMSASDAHIVMITDGYQPADIRAAIGRAAASRGFTTEKDDPGNVVVAYTKGARMLKLGIEYNPQKVVFHYIDSQGMAAGVDPNGQPMLDRHYAEIVTKLDSAISEELKRPGREAAAVAQAQSEAAAAAERQARQDQVDAEERQRQYNLHMEHEKTRQANANQAAAEARASMPPAMPSETQSPQPGPDFYWTPGHWDNSSGRYQWVAGFWAQQYAPQAPPPPQMESPGMPPSDNMFWVRGTWRWGGNGYAWVSGHWDTARTGFVFVPPHWENNNGRWVHAEGRWINR